MAPSHPRFVAVQSSTLANPDARCELFEQAIEALGRNPPFFGLGSRRPAGTGSGEANRRASRRRRVIRVACAASASQPTWMRESLPSPSRIQRRRFSQRATGQTVPMVSSASVRGGAARPPRRPASTVPSG